MKHVLVTGATGVVGSEVARLLLQEPDTRVTAIIRADSSTQLNFRRDELLSYWGLGRESAERFQVLRGDITEKQLNLSDAHLSQLETSLTHFIHSAASVRLNLTLDEAREVAVKGSVEVLKLSEHFYTRGKLIKLDLVSTIGVAGRMQGRIPETLELPERKFRNTYEQAKAEAEDRVKELFGLGLPITVHRPSMVVADSVTGRIRQQQVFPYLIKFAAGLVTNGFIPEFGSAVLDIIPVDYVAKAIVASSNDPSFNREVLHLCSGPEGAIRITDLSQMYRELLRGAGQTLPELEVVSKEEFMQSLKARSGKLADVDPRRLNSLPYLLDYLDEEQIFEVTRTASLLKPKGITIPDIKSCLERILIAGNLGEAVISSRT